MLSFIDKNRGESFDRYTISVKIGDNSRRDSVTDILFVTSHKIKLMKRRDVRSLQDQYPDWRFCFAWKYKLTKSAQSGFESRTQAAPGLLSSAQQKRRPQRRSCFVLGGGGEIRTRGTLRHSCFQDRCTKPLCDSSNLAMLSENLKFYKYAPLFMLYS